MSGAARVIYIDGLCLRFSSPGEGRMCSVVVDHVWSVTFGYDWY